jgi:hypothetical protein
MVVAHLAEDMEHTLAAEKVLSRRSKRQPWCLSKMLDQRQLAEQRCILEVAPQVASSLLQDKRVPLAVPILYLRCKYSHRTLGSISKSYD